MVRATGTILNFKRKFTRVNIWQSRDEKRLVKVFDRFFGVLVNGRKLEKDGECGCAGGVVEVSGDVDGGGYLGGGIVEEVQDNGFEVAGFGNGLKDMENVLVAAAA